MIFQASMAALIVDRRKTEMRVLVGPHRFREGELEHRCRYRAGRSYGMQVRAEWTVARLRAHRSIVERTHPVRVRALLAYLDAPLDASVPAAAGRRVTVVEVRRERLGDASASSMRREGFKFAADFHRHYREVGLGPDAVVWVIAFVLDDVTERFDRPRLLAARPGRGGDYVSRPGLAMRGSADPGEAPSAAQLAGLSARAQQHWLARQAEMAQRIAGQTLAERMGALSRADRSFS